MSLRNKKPETDPWDRNRGVIRTAQGGWFAGEAVYNHGYDMMRDLVGKASFMQIVALNATGRLPERKFADWLDAAHICSSWPDPRIWCNHVGALAGSMKTSVVSAIAAGILASDSKSYGPGTMVASIEFIQQALHKFKSGASVAEIVETECRKHNGKPIIMGYARPLAKGDERIAAMENTSRSLGFETGEHLSLAYDIEQYLIENYDEGMNISGYLGAFFADQGYSPQEAYRIGVCVTYSGITACYSDTMDKPASTFLPMRCDDIDYQGKDAREVPDK